MLLRFFKHPLPQTLIVIILFAIIIWGKFLFAIPTLDTANIGGMPLYELIKDYFQNNHKLQVVVCFSIVLITALYLLQINSKHIIIKNRTYLPALIFILLCSGLPILTKLNPAIFSVFFLLFASDHLLSIYHKEDANNNLFKSGFYIAIASLFYAPSIIYVLATILSIFSIKTSKLRELLLVIIGFLTPWAFYFLYNYFVSNHWSMPYQVLIDNLFSSVDLSEIKRLRFYIYAGFFSILFIVSGIFLFRSLQIEKISVRKYFGVFYWFNLFSIIAVIFIPNRSFEIVYMIAIPIVYQFSYYFAINNKKFWPSLLFNLMILIVLVMQFLPQNKII